MSDHTLRTPASGPAFGSIKNSWDYPAYKSPYGPKMKVQPNIAGFTAKSALKLGVTLGAFGGVAGFVVVYILSDAPRFRRDLMSKLPIIGKTYIREIPPSDNPF
ncbi:ubiquinol-cytochrome-c reductase complex subunit-domain-containing protein [Calycina marina]|uniref:Ubiquinol-cytochrome-c reductase complex subunit-domain-containing protein n=1 Tax=Calycina marina TaxID=1763456 RepID=A0A9P7YX35_9HELO|nr:ubiquinol-cytochrome-c reductase complex subunit-domain-containing protein [Calycina marina]